ncbi:MAG: hypothetical protein IPM69_10480 [Ignavibacteria bacterium]|nr:hypothetical protein [Ignavibacteria bacterium]
MKLSEDTQAILDYLTASEVQLRKPNDIGALLEIGAETGAAEDMNDMILAGKNIWSVYGIIKKMRVGEEGMQNMEEQFMIEMNTLRTLLVRFLGETSDITYRRFELTYLGMSQGTIRNLVDLSHDLAALKNLQNRAKYDS